MDAVQLGRGIRALRQRRRWRQQDLADAVGCSPALVCRVERGHGDVVTPRHLEQLAQALGARLVLRLDWMGEALDRLLDEAHAAIVEEVVGILRSARWEVAAEATFAIGGERGSIDVLAWHPPSASLLVVEVKSVLADAQDTLARLDRKVRLATRIAPPAWRARTASSLLVIGETRTNRRRVEALEATFEAAFPDRIAAIRSFIRGPEGRTLRGLWFLPYRTHPQARHRVRVSRQPRARLVNGVDARRRTRQPPVSGISS